MTAHETEAARADFARAVGVAERLLANIETVVHGKREEIRLVLAALASGGHVLFEDVPGTAKTVLARAIARIDRGRGRHAHPVHARPAADRRDRALDLQPEDARVRVPAGADLRERRARRRDQPRDAEDAVGAARGDGRAAGDGRRRDAAAARAVPADRDREPDRAGGHVPAPRGAARPLLPEDRARLPRGGQELRIMREQRHGHPLGDLRAAWSRPTRSPSCSAAVEDVYVDELLGSWIVELVRATRDVEGVEVGASVRGSLALERTARAWALLHGRDYVTPEDVERLFLPVARAPPAPHAGVPRRDAGAEPRRGARPDPRPLPRAAPPPEPDWEERTHRASRGRRAARDCAPRPFPLVPRWRLTGLPFGEQPQPAPRPRLRRGRLARRTGPATGLDDRLVRDRPPVGGARPRRVRRPREATRTRRRASSSSATAGPRWRSTRPSSRGCRSPRRSRAVADAIVVSALAARGDVGYLDYAGAAARGAPYWLPPRGGVAAGRSRNGSRLPSSTRRRTTSSARSTHLARLRARPAGGQLRLRRLRLPRAAAARTWLARAIAPLGPRPRDRPGPGLGAELPASSRRSTVPFAEPGDGRVVAARFARSEARDDAPRTRRASGGCSASFAASVSTRSSSARATRSRSTARSSSGPSSDGRDEGARDEPSALDRGRGSRGRVRGRTRARRDARRWRRRCAGAQGRRRHLHVARAQPALLRRPRHGARAKCS